ncbi:MAG: DMT family protein [Armatimonadetes bacterium]|nr:DMT family protein [Armatimonadota bacterium]
MRKLLLPTVLLVGSNTFMNTAWYGHLKYKSQPLWIAILASWGIAFFEYCLQVPANRIGNEVLTLTQLKVIQESISILTFIAISYAMFKEKPTTNQWIALVLIVVAAFLTNR